MAEVKVFNPAKKYSDEVLQFLIKSHSNAGLTSSFGAISVEGAKQYSPGQRRINRYNALKEKVTLQKALINEISGTVKISGTAEEKEMLLSITKNLNIVEGKFESDSDEVIFFELKKGVKTPVLTEKFEEVNKYLGETYIIIQSIMTKNKLLFVSENDSFLEDQELMDKIVADNLKS